MDSSFFKRQLIPTIQESIDFFPVVAIIGPRQVGKTTLVKSIMQSYGKPAIYIDLEKPSDNNKLSDPELFFSHHSDKLIIIDEVQNNKDLYPIIRAWVDQSQKPSQFLLLGSASPELIRHSSESLAGRIAYHQLFPFHICELPDTTALNDLWIFGGFPKMLFSNSASFRIKWMDNFVNTYLNRDLLQLGLNASPKIIRNLWSMLAHLNGQLLNYSNLANSLGVTSPTLKRYTDFLEDAFLLRCLYPFSGNAGKRLIKSPKVYLTDTGILHYFAGVSSFDSLLGNPIVGSSWEAFVVNQIYAVKSERTNLFFYRTQHGSELDLVFVNGQRVAATAEIKYSNAPKLSKGNFQAINDLNAEQNFVITPSSDDYLLKDNVRVCSIKTFVYNYLPRIG